MVETLKKLVISESDELCPICHLYIHRGAPTKMINGQKCHAGCYDKIKDKMEATPKWKRLFKHPSDYLQAESKNSNKKTVINLNEFSTEALTEEKKILKEGLWKTLLAGLAGWLLGKRSQKLIIRGKESQIKDMEKMLTNVYKSNKEKDELIDKLRTMAMNTSNINKLRDDFYAATGVRLPN